MGIRLGIKETRPGVGDSCSCSCSFNSYSYRNNSKSLLRLRLSLSLSPLFLFIGLVSCVQGHCRRQTEIPEAAQPMVKEAPAPVAAPETISVFKYDGSLQCGMGKAIGLEVMAKQLHGIPIKSMVKKSDGLMHIQVCGSISGMANVFEIPFKFEKQAEAKGFKKWSFE